MRAGAAWSVALTLAGQLAGLIAVVFASRRLGPFEMGVYTYCYGVTAYLALPVNFGFAVTATHDVAAENSSAEATLAEMLALQIGLAVILYAAAFAADDLLAPTAGTQALLPISMLQLLASAAAVDWALQAKQRVVAVAAWRLVSQLIYLAVVLLAVKNAHNVVSFTVANLVGWATYALATVGVAFRSGRPNWGALSLQAIVKRARRSAAVGYGQVMVLIYYYADVILLQLLHGSRDAGMYGVASRVPLALIGLAGVWGTVVLPRASYLGREGRFAEMRAEMGPTVSAIVVLAGFVVAVSYLVAPTLVVTLFGRAFAPAVAPFTVLMIGAAIVMVASNFTPMLVGLGEARIFARATTCGAIVNVGANLALIPGSGPVGAAWATVAAELVVLAFGITVVFRRVGRPDLDHRRVLAWLVPVAVVVGILSSVRAEMTSASILAVGSVLGLVGVAGAVRLSQRTRMRPS
jgi:O-antigen/teichoic acid export membrane protein